jgi:hypothetical protein
MRFAQLTPRARRPRSRSATGSAIEVVDVRDSDRGSFASFSDPDGNGWAIQQVRPRGAPA